MGDLQRVRRTSLRSKNSSERPERRFGVISFVLLVFAIALGIVGWQYRSSLEHKTTRVSGAVQASHDEIVRLVAIDSSTTLYSIDPRTIEDRVSRHPWVRNAKAHRLPTGVLKISVSERNPVLTVLSASGSPSHYVDAECYMMPLTGRHQTDIPLVSGRLPRFHPTARLENTSLCTLAAAIARSGKRLDHIVSEFVIDGNGDITLYTQPAKGKGSLPVKLGRTELLERLEILQSFWEQVLQEGSTPTFKQIDLRFDSQVVTE